MRLVALLLAAGFAYVASTSQGWLVPGAVIGAFLVGAFLWPLGRRGDALDMAPKPVAPSVPVALDDDGRKRVEAILRASHKIEAIKEARLLTGLGLKEAKDLVESIEAKMVSG